MGACSSPIASRVPRERVIVGVIGSFSQDPRTPTYSDEVARGVQVTVNEYNESSQSHFEARIQQAETKGTAEGAAEAARSLAATEFLIGVVGPFVATEVTGAGPVFDELGVPFLVPSVSDVAVSQAGFKQMRRMVADSRAEGFAFAGTNRSSKVALVHDGSGIGVAFAEGAKQKAETSGGTITRMQEASGAIDWPVLATEILADSPAVVMHGGAPDRSGALVAALRTGGFKGRFSAMGPALNDAAFSQAAGPSAEGVFTDSVCAAIDDPDLSRFTEAHAELFRAEARLCAHEAYEATQMLLEAVEEVGPQPQEVAAFFRSARNFLGDARLFEYAEDGSLAGATIWVYEFRRGAWRFVRRANS